MSRSIEKKKQTRIILFCLIVAHFVTCGFFDPGVAVTGIVIIGVLIYMTKKGEVLYQKDAGKIFLIPLILLGLATVVSLWAVDYMDNMMGVMRIAIICLWMYLLRSRSKEEREEAKNKIPLLGCMSIGISFASFLIPGMEALFWENSRLAGFFQYANTNGLFYALGILIIAYRIREQKKKRYDILQAILLMTGLLLSGSRSVLLILLLWGLWYAIREKKFRKPFFIGSGAALLVGGSYASFTGNTENIGRIFTLFTSNSTMWGRLLYYRQRVQTLLFADA